MAITLMLKNGEHRPLASGTTIRGRRSSGLVSTCPCIQLKSAGARRGAPTIPGMRASARCTPGQWPNCLRSSAFASSNVSRFDEERLRPALLM